MYTLIDELVEAICKDEIYITYRNNAKHLEQGEIKRLLLQQQILQEDYMRLRDLEKYVSIDETKNQLKDIKQQVASHPVIQAYYQSYYELNELLEEVTYIVFNDITQELELTKWK